MAAAIVGLIVLSFVTDDGDGASAPTAAPSTVGTAATTTTHAGVFPPADLDSTVCGLLTAAEAEALVGHPVANEPVEPLPGQCAWPDEAGGVVGELYLIVKEREDASLRDVLAADWGEEGFRFEEALALGESAMYVVQEADVDTGSDEFVVGLSVHVDTLHVILGNGGRPSWEGSPDEVKERLAASMGAVLERIEERLS